jgi:hypothetical protein
VSLQSRHLRRHSGAFSRRMPRARRPHRWPRRVWARFMSRRFSGVRRRGLPKPVWKAGHGSTWSCAAAVAPAQGQSPPGRHPSSAAR